MDVYECLTTPPFVFMLQRDDATKTHFLRLNFGQIPLKLHQTPALEFEAPAVQLWFMIIKLLLSSIILSMLILCCLLPIYCPVILQETTNDFFTLPRRMTLVMIWWHQPSSHYLHGRSFVHISEGYPCNLSSLSLMRSKEGTCERTRIKGVKRLNQTY